MGGARPDGSRWLETFDDLAASRHLDLAARRMRERGQGHYTIGSAGHESNALVAAALRPTDPALLHYRSGGFYLARSRQAGRALADGIRDVLLSLMGAVGEPASGGRHKVFGHPGLAIIPQTSTIASHLPRAVGVAFAIDRARRLGVATRWPEDAIAVASFGDASINHSTATGALNTAGYCAEQGLGLPLLFVCEDNGLGISVPSPAGWVAEAAHRPGLRYLAANGAQPQELAEVLVDAVVEIRRTRRPALLHLRTVRFLGHAGTDVEASYRSSAEVRADRELDPLLAVAACIGGAEPARRYERIGATVQDLAEQLRAAPTLSTRATVMAPLVEDRVAAGEPADRARREQAFGGRRPEDQGGLTLAQAINAGLTDALAARPELLVFGEDVGRKGGVYGVTRGLAQRFRTHRVFDTLLDEQAILGLALGAGVSGLLPVPEIQYLAYLHNAEDQLRGEAASLRFFSAATYANPMVVRVAGLAYQKGFGGHFHNDNALAVLRDIPGLVVAVPARPDDAGPLLRTCLGLAAGSGRVCVYLEPIALYHERDLHAPGDRGWLGDYDADATADLGRARTHGAGADLTIVTFGNGLRMSLRVGARLRADGIGARVVDLRWLAPLPVQDLRREAAATGRVLVVDETRHSGGVGEGVVTALVEDGFDGRIARVASADSFIPLGPAADLVLLGEPEIEAAARRLVDHTPA
ncbi:MAG: thiamine pyrophosphate-dependent enzyme [Actinomycetota bacterium]|nr:thiamine pyrophosphate-dependent enzyme [Actinomycetota bacterium]